MLLGIGGEGANPPITEEFIFYFTYSKGAYRPPLKQTNNKSGYSLCKM